MFPEVWTALTVLTLWAKVHAVRQCRFKPIEINPHDVHALIHNKTRQLLPYSLAHDARLTVIHGKTFFTHYGGNMRGEPINTLSKLLATRKGEIIGIPCVLSACRCSQPRQSAVQPVRAEIRQSGRSRRSLRQMWLVI